MHFSFFNIRNFIFTKFVIVVIIIIIAVVANTMSMTYRERIGEYAIFKTLGYRGWRIAGMILGDFEKRKRSYELLAEEFGLPSSSSPPPGGEAG